MPYTLLPTLLLQIVVVGLTPGPANIYALAMSLKFGYRQAMKMWLGLLTGFYTAMLGMALLTYFMGMAFGNYIVYLKYIGAVYILYLAYQIINGNKRMNGKHRECSFYSGLIVQLTNAKMLLFDLTSFSAFVLPYSNKLIDLIELGTWLLLAGPGSNLVWLLAGSYLRRFFERYGKKVDMVCGVALIFCAIYIVWG